MTGKKENIAQVVAEKLCNTCGACYAVCRAGAITYEETVGGYFLPKVDDAKCDNCGLCFRVCPGIRFSESLMESLPADPFEGKALCAYVGRAKNDDVFRKAQSGGFVTAFLAHALEAGLADAALTVKMEWGDPPRATARLARSVKEITEAQGSKYCPVPLLSVLRGNLAGNERLVVAALACQVHGLWNIFEEVPGLKERVPLVIGLFCNGVMTNAAIDYLIFRAGMSEGGKKIVYFRDKECNGYPGDVRVRNDKGKDAVMPAKARMGIKRYFTPVRCGLCFDKMNVFSDISIGDTWGVASAGDKLGASVCIVRNERGGSFVRSAMAKGIVELKASDHAGIIAGQKIGAKRGEWRGFSEAWTGEGFTAPNYYERVKQYVKKTGRDGYSRKIRFSIFLDTFGSRRELIRYVRLRRLIRDISDILMRPFRILLRSFRRDGDV